MKVILSLIFFVLLIFLSQTACKDSYDEQSEIWPRDGKEKFVVVDADEFNKILAKKNEVLSAKDVMKLYYPIVIEAGEGNEKIETAEKTLDNGNTEITLIYDNQLDDSVRGDKFVMELSKTKNKWSVISIKKNWRCWSDRGHEDWGVELCR